jgi:hypothetical protein
MPSKIENNKLNKKPVRKIMKKRRKKSKMYFGQPVQDAIIRYNESSNPAIRNRIYGEHIHAAFLKMAENLIHTFKFYYFDVPLEQVKHEVVSFMVLQLPKYKAEKGRAFSYFSIVGKNYLILNNNNVFGESEKEEVDDFNTDFVSQMLEYWDNNLTNIFRRQKDILVADSVLELFRRRMNIENFNKKALYIMIREMTGSNTQHITRVINQMKKYYFGMLEEFSGTGGIDTSNTGSIF